MKIDERVGPRPSPRTGENKNLSRIPICGVHAYFHSRIERKFICNSSWFRRLASEGVQCSGVFHVVLVLVFFARTGRFVGTSTPNRCAPLNFFPIGWPCHHLASARKNRKHPTLSRRDLAFVKPAIGFHRFDPFGSLFRIGDSGCI